jgi:DNA repair protein RadD
MVKFVPRPHQQRCVDDFWKYLTNASGDAVGVQPTGAGKSLICAMIAKEISEADRRMVILAPKQELVEQNYEKLKWIAPEADSGIYCAGLKRKDVDNQVIFATIQSVYKRPLDFGFRHLALVDECHTIPRGSDGMFNEFFHGLRINNPSLRKIGLTATPYRLDSGLIYGDGEQFDDVCHVTGIPELLQNGYIAPVRAASVKTISMDGVRKVAGDFDRKQMSDVYSEKVIEACQEIVDVANAEKRRHCLVFGVSIEHCEALVDTISRISGQEVGMISGDTPSLVRATTIDRYKSGELRWLVNCDVLTTGFDAPSTDLIAVCRSTASPGLFYQIAGRGFRLAEGKKDCLLLDFGGNLARHGALDSDEYGEEALKKKNGEAVNGECPMKNCPNCGNSIPAQCKTCPECRYRFPEADDPNHESEAESFAPALESDAEAIGERGEGSFSRRMHVEKVRYYVHAKRGAAKTDPRTLRVDYDVYEVDSDGSRLDALTSTVSEWVCLEHTGWTRGKAEGWWRKRSVQACPTDCDDAYHIAINNGLATPAFIDIKREGDYDRIVAYTGWNAKPDPVKTFFSYSQDDLPF